jgi:polyhydroxyalkanoate synthesis regulator protein
VLPVNVLTDLVRSYATNMQAVMPQFLASSFEMLRESQAKMMENLTHFPNPDGRRSGVRGDAQAAGSLPETMMGGMPGWPSGTSGPEPEAPETRPDDLADIKKQLAELAAKLSKL